MRVVVVALGKIGLPLAAFAALRGHEVVGVDIDADVVATVNAGREPFPGEAGLAAALGATVVGVAPGTAPAGDGAGTAGAGSVVVPGGTLVATTDVGEALAPGADLVLLVPPLVVDAAADPEWRALDAAVSAVGAALGAAAAARGTSVGPDGDPPSVVVETTLPVGSTRGRVAELLARASGLLPGRDLHVAHSPERVYSGRIFADLETYPKLVGGLDAEGERVTAGRYVRLLHGDAVGSPAPAVEVRSLGGAEAAELTKLAETTYRDLNIAFANELAVHADRIGVDVAGVIDAANSQPFSHIHRPGVAVGGHCIPVYPRFYLAGDPDAALPAAARAVNEAMPAYAVGLLADALAPEGTPRGAGGGDGGAPSSLLRGARVLVLGAAYRGGVRETAFSGVFGLRDAVVAAGGTALVADPLFDDDALRGLGLEPWDGAAVAGAVLQADHAEYRALAPGDLPGVRAIVDGRDVLDPAPWAAAGVVVRRIGRDAAAPVDLP